MTVLIAVFGISVGHAQGFYTGASVALLTDGYYPSPLVGIQVGAGLAESLELRATVETILVGSSLSADLLYRLPLDSGLTTYLGAGPEVLFSPGGTITPAQTTLLSFPNYALHGTLGLEVRTGRAGFFGEVQPILTLAYFCLGYTKVRTVVNYYF